MGLSCRPSPVLPVLPAFSLDTVSIQLLFPGPSHLGPSPPTFFNLPPLPERSGCLSPLASQPSFYYFSDLFFSFSFPFPSFPFLSSFPFPSPFHFFPLL